MARIDVSEAAKLSRHELEAQIGELIPELLIETRLQLNAAEQRAVIETLLDEMLASARSSRCSPTTPSPTSW